jgi:hypothetical protein
MEDATRASTPAHLWIAAILGTLCNCLRVFDFVMTETVDQEYLAKYGPDATAYYLSFPEWFVAFWALGVWSGLAGSLLLLARSKHATMMFALSLVGLFVTTVYQFLISPPPADLATTGMLLMVLLTWAIAIALFLYARDMHGRGVLGELT